MTCKCGHEEKRISIDGLLVLFTCGLIWFAEFLVIIVFWKLYSLPEIESLVTLILWSVVMLVIGIQVYKNNID